MRTAHTLYNAFSLQTANDIAYRFNLAYTAFRSDHTLFYADGGIIPADTAIQIDSDLQFVRCQPDIEYVVI